MAVAGAPSIERAFGLSHAAYVALVFVGPLLLAAVLEAGVALLSDVADRCRLVVAGQAGLAASLVFVAWTKSAWGLTLGLAFAGTTSGVACGAAQALLVVEDPRGTDRVMVRWALFSAVGDLLTPLVTASAIALGYSYRGATLVVAVVVALQGVGSALVGRSTRDRANRGRAGAVPGDDDKGSGDEKESGDDERSENPLADAADPLHVALARAIRSPRLWAWLFAAASCTLLDELVVALATLRFEREQGLTEALAVGAAVLFAAGSVLGAALTDRLVARAGARRVLLASAALCAVTLSADVAFGSVLASGAALFVVGVTCAPHHALAQARAYDELPANPGTVQAIGRLFTAIEIVAPLMLGVVADRYGLRVAIACLGLQPLVIAACAAFAYARPL